MAALPPIGSIVEFETPHGFAYGEYLAEHTTPPHFGSLIRIVKGLHETRVRQLDGLGSDADDLLVAYYPLSVWLRRGIATTVVEGAISRSEPHSYTFKLGDDGSNERWAIWDETDGERFVGSLTSRELTEYPDLEVFDELALIAEIVVRSGSGDFETTDRWYKDRWVEKNHSKGRRHTG